MEQEETKEEDEKAKYDALEISDTEFALCCCLFDTLSLRLHVLFSAPVHVHFSTLVHLRHLHFQTAVITLLLTLLFLRHPKWNDENSGSALPVRMCLMPSLWFASSTI